MTSPISLPNLAALGQLADLVRVDVQKFRSSDSRSKHFALVIGALDALNDAETAIFTYFEDDWPSGAGRQLIRVWGLLRAFIILQDSVIELRAAADGTSYLNTRKEIADKIDVLSKTRDFCDHFVGHPANRSWGKKPKASATLNRHIPDRNQIRGMLRFTDHKAYAPAEIDVCSATEKQAEALLGILAPVGEWARK